MAEHTDDDRIPFLVELLTREIRKQSPLMLHYVELAPIARAIVRALDAEELRTDDFDPEIMEALAYGRSIPDGSIHPQPTPVLEALARDFGPETAALAEKWGQAEREPRDVPRELRKLDAAGKGGFR